MNDVVTMLSASEAQRLTQRIKLTASSVRDGLFKLRNLVEEARNSNVWQILGHASWTAYLADTLADEPMRLGRDERQELVGYLSGEGLSTRAIAPIVGVSHETVAQDISKRSSEPVRNLTPPTTKSPVEHPKDVGPSAPVEEVGARTESLPVAAPTITPEPVEVPQADPIVPRPIVGMDGKVYTRPEPKPVPRGDDAAQINAETESKALGRALITLSGMKYEEHRNRVITEWWPRGNDSVPPDSRALFEPKAIRDIATWLMQLADDLEVAP